MLGVVLVDHGREGEGTVGPVVSGPGFLWDVFFPQLGSECCSGVVVEPLRSRT